MDFRFCEQIKFLNRYKSTRLLLIRFFLLKYVHFYYLISEHYPDYSSFSLFDKKWKPHQMPVSFVNRSGSYFSVFEQTAQNLPYLPFCDDI